MSSGRAESVVGLAHVLPKVRAVRLGRECRVLVSDLARWLASEAALRVKPSPTNGR
jgi:hypothetical protein